MTFCSICKKKDIDIDKNPTLKASHEVYGYSFKMNWESSTNWTTFSLNLKMFIFWKNLIHWTAFVQYVFKEIFTSKKLSILKLSRISRWVLRSVGLIYSKELIHLCKLKFLVQYVLKNKSRLNSYDSLSVFFFKLFSWFWGPSEL